MKLIILNGSSGVGKSTVAERLHLQMPSSVLIDIDELRRTIPNYREKREESLRLAYEYADNAIEDGLKAGSDVIIDKAILQPEVLDTFVALAHKYDAKVVEFLLFAEKENVQKRAEDRGFKAGGMLTPEKVVELWEKADAFRRQRTDAIIIDTTHISPEEVFSMVSKRVE
ncbi:ATP-binding protein [Candidatus Kaiserbacteria bacterium]|nr:ATP-binding protein [Candidatus Kaiserbacteria bacterium]